MYHIFNPKARKFSLRKDVTFLNKSYGWKKVEKPTVVSVNCEGLDDDKEVGIVLVYNENNYDDYYVVGDSESNDEIEKNLLE